MLQRKYALPPLPRLLPRCGVGSFLTVWLIFLSPAQGVNIDGVQAAALDQPQINVCLRRQAAGAPLQPGGAKNQDQKKATPKKDDPFAALFDAGPSYNIQAFLDTGSSGVMISPQTADALGVQREQVNGKAAIFHDVGVGGGDQFNISEPLIVAIAPFSGGAPSGVEQYTIQNGPMRLQIGPLSQGLLQALTGGLDVLGMPVLTGKTIVLDPKPVDTFADTIRTRVYDPDHPQGALPPPHTSRHVQLSFGAFSRFTSVDPPDSQPPAMYPNPFIGPSPVDPARNDRTPPIAVSYAGQAASGSFLLDTGAVTSMISTQMAGRLGVHYAPNTQGTDHPKLAGIADKEQFTLAIGGIGGTHQAAGFYLDTLTLPTIEGDPIVYRHAPVLISDISVKDPETGQTMTLDGVLGMNYFVATAAITGGALLPDLGKLTQGPYKWVVIDLRAGRLGLELK
jgi:hypothetical protein